MSNIVLRAENISKQYRLGQSGTGTISHDLNRFWATLRGKEDPYLKVGDANDRTKAGGSDYVWSLKDINFEVKQGEVLGIIGRNGAGKSTLLKILSQVTTPTTGQVKVKGRIAALLEVGTGFHPDLTGRENIFLNGAILGMTKFEIKSKLDEIVDFSGVARYLDTPVKRYSSGMTVRLGFAIAAHLEPEILIVDEVLAVGDAEFQRKCLGKMKDVSGQGRTVFFVSHNMVAIRNLCSSVLYLKNGRSQMIGKTGTVIEHYLSDKNRVNMGEYLNTEGNNTAFLRSAYAVDTSGNRTTEFTADEVITLIFEIEKKSNIKGIYGHVMILNSEEIPILETDTLEQENNELDSEKIGVFISRLTIPRRILKTGTYTVSFGLASPQFESTQIESLLGFLQFEVQAERTARDLSREALISTIMDWKFKFEAR